MIKMPDFMCAIFFCLLREYVGSGDGQDMPPICYGIRGRLLLDAHSNLHKYDQSSLMKFKPPSLPKTALANKLIKHSTNSTLRSILLKSVDGAYARRTHQSELSWLGAHVSANYGFKLLERCARQC